jgi:hypothetical protein
MPGIVDKQLNNLTGMKMPEQELAVTVWLHLPTP